MIRYVAAALALLVAACAPVELLATTGALCDADADCNVMGLCIGGACHPCPSLDACVEPAPQGKWTKLERNGCAVCEFAPAAECYGPSDCDGVCYRGARCASGCTRLECCANVCDVAGCSDAPPLGCDAACPPEMSGCDVCVAAACTCTPSGWRCDVGCANLSAGCTYVAPP